MPKKYVNTHKGETCLVVGNGPSLNDVPLAFLHKYPTFGSNWCMLHEFWTPDYYVAVDPSVVRLDYFIRLNAMNCVKFISKNILNRYRCVRMKNVVPIKTNGTKAMPGFLLDPPRHEFWEGWSVTYVALNIAYLMGFTTALMVGVDHRYTQGEPNHFHPDYENGTAWKIHDMTKALEAYEMAKKAYEDDNRMVINLTPGSDLQVFEMGRLEDWQ